MNSDTLAIIGVGVTLLLVILGVWRDLKSELRDLRIDVNKLSERVARIEGRLDERSSHNSP